MSQSVNTDLASLRNFKVLTFDCYGTLIDWEKGILVALKSIGIVDDDNQRLLSRFASVEHVVQEEEPGLLYPQVLARCADRLAQTYNVKISDELRLSFGASVQFWPPFPDTPEALQRLQKHFKLVILSNVNRDSFALSEKNMNAKFDLVCTAQDIGSYKPDLRNFHYVLDKVNQHFGAEKSQVLHVFQSLFHDAVPATAMGMATAHIDRRFGMEGGGATPTPTEPFKLNFSFKTLGEFADAVDAAFASS